MDISITIITLITVLFLIKYCVKKIKKYRKIYLKNGLDGVYYYFINKNVKKTGLNNFIDKTRRDLLLKVSKKTNQEIYSGPYKGVKLLNLFSSYNVDIISASLGTYELEVQKKIIDLSNNFNLKTFVDLGAGEGFHIVSLLKKKIFRRGLAYEIDKKSRETLSKNLKLNNLENIVEIYNEANFESLKKNIDTNDTKDLLFLIDIEGNEFDLLTKDFCEYFQNSFFIIEDHNFNVTEKNKKKIFYELIKSYFIVEVLEDKGKDPFSIDILKGFNDDEKYLMMSEGRPESMQWLILKPKNS